ncbi:hypothetical protein JQ608_45315 [Bradyrhizobium liaoningense]|uniref:hypothetical protein n=1 Tax=Bradyrhizobium liaoningense TaxID=43992 RepID=UPI001BA5644C|nr:hypothetical protein [Bradyrhizobium liaoningense]MBR0884124.1 hypothetical protein [Bradyrhizobium liaoningense]
MWLFEKDHVYHQPEAQHPADAGLSNRPIAGRIVHINESKRYAFVARDDRRGVRVFCRLNDLQRAGVAAAIGTRVLFEIGERDGRPVVVAIEHNVHANH